MVAAVHGLWLAVDEIQPVAVTLSPTGDVLDVVSWNRLAPPETVDWPTRWLITEGSTAWVHDQPDGPSVRLDVSTSGSLTADPDEVPPSGAGLVRSYARFGLRREFVGEGVTWGFRSRLADFRWEAETRRTTPDGERSWSLGAGTISSCATTGSAAAACVSRATKRPWTFRPGRDLVVVSSVGDPVTVLPHGSLDIAQLSWPRPSPMRIEQALAEYLPFTLAESRSAIANGADDLQIRVGGLDDIPTIETSFRWKGPRYVRVDEPIDELGRLFGFQFLTIILDEDMAGGGPFRPGPPGTTVSV